MKRFEDNYDMPLASDSLFVKPDREIKSDDQDESAKDKKRAISRVKTTMLSRNINVLGHRTSIRLEKEMWESLKAIASREKCKVHDICSLVQIRKRADTSLTAAIRVFVMLYYKAAATEDGHMNAGHGSFSNMKRRAGLTGDLESFREYSNQQEQKEQNAQDHDVQDRGDCDDREDHVIQLDKDAAYMNASKIVESQEANA